MTKIGKGSIEKKNRFLARSEIEATKLHIVVHKSWLKVLTPTLSPAAEMATVRASSSLQLAVICIICWLAVATKLNVDSEGKKVV